MAKKRTRNYRSPAAKNVAKEVLANIGNGKRPIMKKILANNGYPPSMQKNPKLVTDTLSYKEEMDPIVKKWIIQRDRFTNMLSEFKRKEDKIYLNQVLDAINQLTRNIQLLNEKPTENITINKIGNILDDSEK